MGLYDRPYWREPRPQGGGAFGQMRIGFPKPARAVKWLLLINLAAFVVQLIFATQRVDVSRWLGVTVAGFWQVWRYVTFQFLHGGFLHIFMNMLVLYMFGSQVERHWGLRRFLKFYLSCGVVAGLTYAVIAAVVSQNPGMEAIRGIPLIGASGGVYGILLACAVLFPHMRIILFVFPMSMRTAALIIFGIAVLYVLGGWGRAEFWSHVAHLGGAGMAGVWLWVIPRARGRAREAVRRASRGAWERKMRQRREDEAAVDRILQKIHHQGISSLTRREKRILQEATRRQQREDNEMTRL
jgi:membrane associated rhomboid family serine protease